MRRLNAAIIGCGGISLQRHIPSWQRTKKARVAAVCDISEKKVNDVARRLGVPGYTDYREILQNEEIDVVDVAVPTKHHYEVASEAIRKGKHVIVEKPIASNVDEARTMIDLANKCGVKLSVFHTMKAYPAIRQAKDLMEKGEIGKPILLHFLTVCPTLQPWVAGQGGRLWEVGIHRIYLSQYLFGRVHKAELHRMGSSEENVLLKLNSEKGMCEIHIVSEFDGPPETLAIVGTKGQISIGRLAMGPVVVQKPMANWRGIFVETVGHDLKSLLSLTGLAIRNLVCGATVSPHHFIINNFLETIAGRAELFVKPEEGLQALEVLERTEE